MKYFIGALALIFVAGGLFLFLKENNSAVIIPISEAPKADSESTDSESIDIEPQKPLVNPPEEIKAVYLTSWSAGSNKKIDYLINLMKETELNAVVIDIKDFSGFIAYDIKFDEVEKYETKEIRIPKLNALIKRLHDENIYIIARITVFQDPILAKARPDLAIHSKKTGGLWLDNKKLAWIDPASKEAWDYNLIIAKDAAERGFDEINFDYIRFASDGNLEDMDFPFWQKTRTNAGTKSEVIRNFFKYLREQLPGVKISVDLFGLTTVQNDDMGIGQLIEDAYTYLDYVSPMIYPSHYANGFLNYENPAKYPYEVVKYSMESALRRLKNYELGIMNNATATDTTAVTTVKKLTPKLRPWLQDFNLGADYDAIMVRKQIKAVYGAASSAPELLNGWMLWNPSNVYTKGALEPDANMR